MKISKDKLIVQYIVVSTVLILVLIAGMVYTNIKLHQVQSNVSATDSAVQSMDGDVQQTDQDVQSTDSDVQNTDSDVQSVCSAIADC
jgi:outer membrane murein-binding lipoprotein Lpp